MAINNTGFVRNLLFGGVILGFYSASCLGQAFPTFPGETTGNFAPEYGVGMAQVPNTVTGSALLMVRADLSNINTLQAAYSSDGQNFSNLGLINPGVSFYQVNCSAATPETCTPAIASFNGAAYIAFAEQNTKGLYVIKATPDPANAGYDYSLVYTNTSVQLTSAPAMVVSQLGDHLLIRYGTSNNPSLHNTTYVTEFDGNSWTTNLTGGYAPTKSAMAVLNGKLYAIDKENDSTYNVYVSQLDDNGFQIANTPYKIPNLLVQHGFSAVTYKGSIVVCVQANTYQNWLYMFSTSDGANWSQQLYSNITTGPAPQLALFNQGVTEAHQANNSAKTIQSAFAAQ